MMAWTAPLRGRVDAVLVLWALALLAGPLYIMPSGLPQPGDALLVLAVGALIASQRGRLTFPPEARTFVGFLVAFALHVFLVSLFWAGWTHELTVLRPIAFYGFNILVTLSVLALLPRYGPAAAWLLATIPALQLIEVLIVGMGWYRPGAARQTLLFNNPNQLGYFVVIAASQFFAAPVRFARRGWIEAAVLVIAGLLTLMSASRAALFALIPLGLQVVLRGRGSGWIVAAAAGVGLMAVVLLAPELIEPVSARLFREGVGRGYDRILNHPEFLLIGAGEGAVYRFETALVEHELHSSIGTVLFSYGIVGLVLFSAALLQPVLVGGWRLLVPMAPPLVYGLTHQGLRFTELWVLLAALMVRAVVDRREAEAARATGAPA